MWLHETCLEWHLYLLFVKAVIRKPLKQEQKLHVFTQITLRLPDKSPK